MAADGASKPAGPGADEIDTIGEAYLDLLQSGQRPDRDAITRAYPHVAQALERRLALLEKLHRASKEWRESTGYLEILKDWSGLGRKEP